MQRILLVEDSPEIQVIVKAILAREYDLVCANSAQETTLILEKSTFDLILLDIILPDGNGFEICAKLKSFNETKDIPIIFLTGRSGVNEKVVGFSLGAEDYVTKPFDPVELKARVQARLLHSGKSKDSAEPFFKGNLRFHLPSMTVTLVEPAGETKLDLTSLEFRLLHYFVNHEETVLSRDQLLDNVWGGKIHVIDRTVDGHISLLRKKLKGSLFTIRAVYGEGYQFTKAPVRGSKAGKKAA